MGVFSSEPTPPEEPQGGKSQTQDAAPTQHSERPSLEDYTTNGRTKVATRRGHQVVPSDPSLPQFGAAGITVTAEQADKLVEEFPEWVYLVDQEGGE